MSYHGDNIESHLFSQYVSYGIPGSLSSLTLTVYGIATMLGAVLTGFLGTRFRMKNVLGTVYALRVVISPGFLLLPKTESRLNNQHDNAPIPSLFAPFLNLHEKNLCLQFIR